MNAGEHAEAGRAASRRRAACCRGVSTRRIWVPGGAPCAGRLGHASVRPVASAALPRAQKPLPGRLCTQIAIARAGRTAGACPLREKQRKDAELAQLAAENKRLRATLDRTLSKEQLAELVQD